MESFESIEAQLPWGFHDALLVRLEVDWLARVAKMDMRVAMNEQQSEDRLGQLTFSELVFIAVEAPELDEARGYVATTHYGLLVDSGNGMGDETYRQRLPPLPPGSFLCWFFVREWNRFIHVCSCFAGFQWLEDTVAPRTASLRALFPGQQV